MPPSLGGCPAVCSRGGGGSGVNVGGGISAPWSNNGAVIQNASQSVAPNPAKFTAVDLNEPSF